MSRSYKKTPIYKDKGYRKKDYWKTVRRVIKSKINNCNDLDNLELPSPKTIIDDWDYCDYVFYYPDKKLKK